MRIPSLNNKLFFSDVKSFYIDCFTRLQNGNVEEPLRVPSVVHSFISRPIQTLPLGDNYTPPIDEDVSGPRDSVVTNGTIRGFVNNNSGEKSYQFTLMNGFERRLVYDKLTKTGYIVAMEFGKTITMYKDGVFSECFDKDITRLIKKTNCW